jgi:rubrerythrin
VQCCCQNLNGAEARQQARLWPAENPGTVATLKQVYAKLHNWVKDPQPSPELLTGEIEQVISRIQEATDAIERDLAAETAAPEFAALLEGNASAYGDLEESLEVIVAALSAQDRDQIQEELVYLKAGMATLRQYTEAIEQWLAAPMMRCPRCGTGEAEAARDAICPTCDLEMLYPDLQPDTQASRVFLNLGSEFIAVYRAYLAVLAGDLPLAELNVPLNVLESWLQRHARVSDLSRDTQLQPQLYNVAGLCRQGLAGVEQMRTSFTSRETADLNAGWGQIFAAAQNLQRCLPQLLADLGIQAPTNNDVGDSIQFSNED